MDKQSNELKTTENKKSKKSFKDIGHEIFFVLVIIVCISLISVVFIMSGQYSQIIDEQVENKATLYSQNALDTLTQRLNELRYESQIIANDVTSHKDDTSFSASLWGGEREYLVKIVYAKDGVIYDTFNSEDGLFHSPDTQDILNFQGDSVTVLGIVQDSFDVMERLAVFVPTPSHPISDSLVLLYSLSALSKLNSGFNETYIEKTSFLALCKTNGQIIEWFTNKDGLIEANVNVASRIRDLTGNKQSSDNVEKLLNQKSGGVLLLEIGGTSYAMTVAKNPNANGICLVGLYNSEEIYSSGYNTLGLILTSIIVVSLLLVVFAIYFILSKKRVNKKIAEFGTVDNDLHCLTRIGFERQSQKSLSDYPGSRFAVVTAEIRRFDYIGEVAGKEQAFALLQNIRSIISNSVRIGEVFGYDDSGTFLLLLQYSQYDILMRRLNQLYRLVLNGLSTANYSVKLNFGICSVVPGERGKTSQYISNAYFAMERGGLEKSDGNYTMYDESLRDSYLKVSDIEIKMDQGIVNHEFKVFYQPKYNLKKMTIDGCEALVRWFDEKTGSYRAPDTFLPLLEANGYISRLDHYVFEEVCRFINNCVSQGVIVVPISVNVSRLTMLEEDFVDYYAKMKEIYQIPDNFLTIEFTESASYENNEKLGEMAKQLHDKGFLCSIDDFGTGYSSYNMLKTIEVDEVKLDKFFIKGCLTNKRAKYVIEGAVNIAKNLNIKVTQEGVEDEKTFEYLKKIGCNVIQGYYYSKPLTEEDFCEFVKTHKNWSGDKINN